MKGKYQPFELWSIVWWWVSGCLVVWIWDLGWVGGGGGLILLPQSYVFFEHCCLSPTWLVLIAINWAPLRQDNLQCALQCLPKGEDSSSAQTYPSQVHQLSESVGLTKQGKNNSRSAC